MRADLMVPAPLRRTYRAVTSEDADAMYRAEHGQQVTIRTPRDQPPAESTIDVVQFGPVRVSRHDIGFRTLLRAQREDLYSLTVGLAGQITVDLRHRELSAGQRAAVVTSPVSGPPVLDATRGSRLECLVIDDWALEAQLESLLDRPVPHGINLASEVDLTGRTGQSLWRLVRLLTEGVADPDNVVFQPIVAEPLCHALLNAVLLAADHPYRESLTEPVSACPPRSVKRAVDAIEAHPEHAFTSASLARLANVSTRTLQAGFQLHLGTSPMAYLRMVRLARAHHDLVTGAAGSVAEAAHRWGFTHLGRFAGQYRSRYGVPPSVTMRADRAARPPGGHPMA